MVFYAPGVSRGASAANKIWNCPALICGSNAAGDLIPVHFQLKTLSKMERGERLNIDLFKYTKKVIGTFGHRRRKDFPCTFVMNEKPGMNAQELKKYF